MQHKDISRTRDEGKSGNGEKRRGIFGLVVEECSLLLLPMPLARQQAMNATRAREGGEKEKRRKRLDKRCEGEDGWMGGNVVLLVWSVGAQSFLFACLDTNLVVEQNDDGDVDLGLGDGVVDESGTLTKVKDGNETSSVDGDALDGGRVDGDTLLDVDDVSDRGEAAATVGTVGVGGRVGGAERIGGAVDVSFPVKVEGKDAARGEAVNVIKDKETVIAARKAANGGAVVNPHRVAALEGAEGAVDLVAQKMTVLVGIPSEDDTGSLCLGVDAVGVLGRRGVVSDVPEDGGTGLDGLTTGGLAEIDADKVDGGGACGDRVGLQDAIINGEGCEL